MRVAIITTNLRGIVEDVLADALGGLSGSLGRSVDPVDGRQWEPALLKVAFGLLASFDDVAGGVVGQTPSVTFPGLRSMLVEGVELVELLLRVDHSPG